MAAPLVINPGYVRAQAAGCAMRWKEYQEAVGRTRRHLLFHLQAAATTPPELFLTHCPDDQTCPRHLQGPHGKQLIGKGSSASLSTMPARLAGCLRPLSSPPDVPRVLRVHQSGPAGVRTAAGTTPGATPPRLDVAVVDAVTQAVGAPSLIFHDLEPKISSSTRGDAAHEARRSFLYCEWSKMI
ncbi:hypothetical protein U9M48_044573 [Paspalum notatum var. saurae]|uniref:Uncharacterized protein n=1 Tax=Paspalum notatum var. saurae TaxID=547442 RepID=A0AAQ3UZM3_PASNO